MFDLIIRNASIINGTGSPASAGDVAVKDGRIAAVGEIHGGAERELDAGGHTLSPGFIDIHSHTDAGLLIDPTAQSKVTQGITLELCGQCGYSPAPVMDEASRGDLQAWRRRHGVPDEWESLGEFLDALSGHKIAVNFATLVGHSNLRAAALGLAKREAIQEEIERMKSLAAQAMREGAFGLSTGLCYAPSCFGTTDEVAQVASAVAAYRGFYASHIRDEREALDEAVAEAIEIGRRAGVPVQIAHLKGYGEGRAERTQAVYDAIREARNAGQDVMADQYPYTASATGLSAFLPDWAHDGGDEAMLERIKARRAELAAVLSEYGDHVWENVRISAVRTEANQKLEGSSIEQVAQARGTRPVDTVLDLLVEESAYVSIVHFCQWEEDIKAVMRSDFAVFCTDSSARSTKGQLSKGKPHPRSFGAFARVLGRYVREQGVIPLETAIRKMTSMPATRLGLPDRGVIRRGAWADIVVFDPDSIIDAATYEVPCQVSRGIDYVVVNGHVTVDHGELTGALAGQVLRGNRWAGTERNG